MSDTINRGDALDALKARAEQSENHAVVAGILMSMNDIRHLPSEEPNISDDGTLTITVKHGMLDKVNRVIVNEVGTKFCKMMYQDAEPSAERKGHWVYTAKKRLDGETDDGAVYVTDYWCTCSECGSDFGYIKMSDKYCKYCGARMVSEDE